MKTKPFFLLLAAMLLACLQCFGQITTYTVTLTNAGGTTNGYTITVNGATRIWTNSVTTNATQIMTNSSPVGSTSNLYNAYLAYPVTGVTVGTNSGTNVVFTSYPGFTLTVSVGGNWATVTSSSTALTNATVVSVPPSIFGPIDLTNIESGLVAFLNDNRGTNTFNTNAPFLVAFVPTNGTFYGIVLGGIVSNASAISGTLFALTNGYLTNTAMYNGSNFGLPFRSPGNGLGSEQFGLGASAGAIAASAFGDGATASQTGSSAFGSGTAATGVTSTALGYNAISSGVGSIAVSANTAANASANFTIAIGPAASASAFGAVALGSNAAATFTNSTAIGPGSSTTAANQVMLGNSSGFVQFPGGVLFTGAETNLTAAGTNTINAELVLKRYNNSGLANGVNQDVQLGTNCDTKLSGPTAAFSTAGFAAPNDDQFNFVQNSTAFQWTINNLSGLESTAANRIFTGTGADLVLSSNSWALLKYDASVSYWILLFASGAPSSGGSGAFSGSFTGNGGGLTNVTAVIFTNYRAGFQAIGNLATSQAVTFSTPFSPTVGTNYTVTIGSDSTLASAVGFSAGSKTTNGFTINLSAGVAGGIGVDYQATPYQ